MPSFSHILQSGVWLENEHQGGRFFYVEVPETWHQGRTAYGGFSSALCLAIAQVTGGESLPPLRSAQFAMMAPVVGQISVSARIDRTGRNATWMSAQIETDKGLAFTASFVFIHQVASKMALNEKQLPENLISVEDAQVIQNNPYTPQFLRNNFENRYALPREGSNKPEICRWVKLLDRDGLDPMVELLLVGDATPPAVLPLLFAGVPVSTMHWQVGMLSAKPMTEEGWWLLRSVSDYAESGCSSQVEAIWSTNGQPIMTGMQSIAIFG